MINQALLSEIFNQPWSIETRYLQALGLSYLAAFKSGLRPESAIKMETKYSINMSDRSRQDSEIQPGSIGVITIDGPIVKNSDGWYGIMGTEQAASEFLELESNPNIIGNILALNSGGGAVYAIKPFTDVLSKRTKPLVIFSKEYLCSAAIRIAAHGDARIMYHPQGIVGSIGTMSSMSNLQPMFEKWGMEFHEIYATLSTLKNNTYNKALEGEYALLKQRVLDPMNNEFIAEMKSLMGHLISSKHPDIWKGETYLAEEAATLGLISGMGTMNDAVQKVIELAEVNPKNNRNPQNQNNTNMKVEKITALANKTEATEEELAEANAELTSAGVTGFSIVSEKVLEQGVQVTKDLETANQKIANLNTELATEKGKVTTLSGEKSALEQKLADNPAAVATVVPSADPKSEKSALEESNEVIAGFSHNQGIANNPLFTK